MYLIILLANTAFGLPVVSCFTCRLTFKTYQNPRGVLGIPGDGDDRMEPNVKTQKNP